jgi:hypothetical protein
VGYKLDCIDGARCRGGMGSIAGRIAGPVDREVWMMGRCCRLTGCAGKGLIEFVVVVDSSLAGWLCHLDSCGFGKSLVC